MTRAAIGLSEPPRPRLNRVRPDEPCSLHPRGAFADLMGRAGRTGPYGHHLGRGEGGPRLFVPRTPFVFAGRVRPPTFR